MDALNRAMRAAEADGIRFDYAQTNGIRMFYARQGRGTPLLLLHGWPEFWMVMRPLMRELHEHYDLIVPDMRGFGATGKARPGPDPTATADMHADDMRGLMDALGIGRFGFVAGDVGAYVLQAFARRYPERLTGAFFFCTPYPGIGPRYGQPTHLIEVWYQYFQQLPWAAQVVGATRASVLTYFRHFWDHWSGDNPAVFADMVEVLTDNFMRNDNVQGGFDWYLSSGPTRVLWLQEKLPKPPLITVPARLLWGRRDPLVPIEWADRLGEYFTNYTIDFVDAGHYVHYEVPALAAAEVRRFFGSLPR